MSKKNYSTVYSELCECNEQYTVDHAVTFLFRRVINKLQSRLCRLLCYWACGWCIHCSAAL